MRTRAAILILTDNIMLVADFIKNSSVTIFAPPDKLVYEVIPSVPPTSYFGLVVFF